MIPDDEHTRYAYREMATPSMFAFSLAIMVAFTLSFTIWDPWGLQETLNAMQRLGFSAAVGLFDILICYSAAVLALYVARRRTKIQALLTLSAMEIVVSVPCTAMWHTTFVLFHDGRPPDASILGLYAIVVVNATIGTVLTAYVLLLRLSRKHLLTAEAPRAGAQASVAAPDNGNAADTTASSDEGAGMDLQADDDDDADAAGASPAVQADNCILAPKHVLNRLRALMDDDIVYLHVSGHYVDVATTSGSEIIMMRLADAIADLGERGMQVHRSYWVAYRHMTRLARRDQRTVLRLTNGREVPVSRTFRPAVREALASAALRSRQ